MRSDPEPRASARATRLGSRRLGAVALASIAFVVACLAIWTFFIEPDRLLIHTTSLVLPRLPAADDGMRVAVITDLHAGAPFIGVPKIRTVVDRTNAANPDLTVILGDLVVGHMLGGHFVPPEQIARELGRLRAPLGVVAVLGNHDGWVDAPRIAAALRTSGITVLRDSAVERAASGRVVWIAGISDLWTGHPSIGRALEPVLAGPDSLPVLLLTHNPDVFPDVPARVSLTLAGHTHGGQINLPFLGPIASSSRFGSRYAAGHVVENGRHLLVGTGIGTSVLPVRFRVPPEILIATLHSR